MEFLSCFITCYREKVFCMCLEDFLRIHTTSKLSNYQTHTWQFSKFVETYRGSLQKNPDYQTMLNFRGSKKTEIWLAKIWQFGCLAMWMSQINTKIKYSVWYHLIFGLNKYPARGIIFKSTSQFISRTRRKVDFEV